jgi:hypothetical protein
MRRSTVVLLLCTGLALLFVAGSAQAKHCSAWNLADDWDSSYLYPNQANPVADSCENQVWSFLRFVPGTGYLPLDGYYRDYSFLGIDNYENWQPVGAEWCDGYYQTCVPAVAKNFNDFPFTVQPGNITIPANAVNMHPSPNQRAVVAWTSPINGHVMLSATFTDIDFMGGDGVNWYVDTAETQLATGFIPAQGVPANFSTERLKVKQGDTFYFSIDSGNAGDLYYDSIQLDVVIAKVP